MRSVAALSMVGFFLLPLVVSCEEDGPTPCCPESGCAHSPSYHCVGGDTVPAHTMPAGPPRLADGTVTIGWSDGSSATVGYAWLVLNDRRVVWVYQPSPSLTPDPDAGETDAGPLEERDAEATDASEEAGAKSPVPSHRRVATIWWSGSEPSPEPRDVDGGVLLCDTPDHWLVRDTSSSRCVGPDGDEYPARTLPFKGTSSQTERPGEEGERLTFATDDGAVTGTLELAWSKAYAVPEEHHPRRCVAY